MAAQLQSFTATGVTVITHGFQPSAEDGDSMGRLAQEIYNRTPGWLLDYDLPALGTQGYFDLTTTPNELHSNVPLSVTSGELVLLFDWAGESNQLSSGWGEAAGDALFSILVGLNLVDPAAPNNNPKLHFIGHSFGTAVTSEVIERLAYFNVPVDQVTYLDPHDFNQGLGADGQQMLSTLGQPFGYGATVWDNVDFADVYYETRGLNGEFIPNFAVPEGRPIPGAYNQLLNAGSELPKEGFLTSPYSSFDASGDHSFVWNGFYLATVMGMWPTGVPLPEVPFDLMTTGYAFSHDRTPTLRPDIALPQNAFATFFGDQDHENSSPRLVNVVTEQPNLVGLANLGMTAQQINTVRWPPLWNPTNLVVNGNFEDFALLDLSPYIFPGWSHHGGGGDGHIDRGARANHYLELDSGDVFRVHNDSYFPANVEQFSFDLWISDRSNDDQLQVFIDSQAFGSPFSLTTSTKGFSRQSLSIPLNMRGQVHNFGFEIVSSNQAVESEVRIDNVQLLTDITPPIVDAVVAHGITNLLLSTNFALPTPTPPVFAVSAGVVQMSGAVVLGAADPESGLRLDGYVFHTQEATDSTGLNWGSTKDWDRSTLERTIEESTPGIYRIWVSAENNVGLIGDSLSTYRYFQVIPNLQGSPLTPINVKDVFQSIGAALKNSAADLISSSQHLDVTGQFPFGVKELSDAVDLPGLFDQLASRFVEEPEIIAPLGNALTNFVLAQDARFILSGDGLAPTEVVVLASTTADNLTIVDLVLDIDTALANAGIGNLLRADDTSDGRLILKGHSDGLLRSLELTTLRLTTDGTLPPFGQIANPQTSSPNDTFNLQITRTFSNELINQLTPIVVTTTTDYHVKIGTAPPAANDEPFAFTQDNIGLADLVDDLNLGFMQQGLFDVVAILDANNQLALIATSSEVKTIEVLRRMDNNNNQSTGLQFGFATTLAQTNNPSLLAGLGFVPTRNENVGKLKFNSIESFLPLLEDKLHELSETPLPAGFSLDPVYDSTTNTLFFNFALNKVFSQPTELDFFDQGITLGSLGTLQAAAVADATLTGTIQLNFRMGVSLAAVPTLLNSTLLSAVNDGDGVPLAVGLTGVAAPTGSILANNVQFTVALNGAIVPVTVTLASATTTNNLGLSDLAADLNAAIGSSPSLAGKIQAIFDVSSGRLSLSALSKEVYSLQIANVSGLAALGFGTSQSGNLPELKITVGGTPYLVDLVDTDGDGVMSIQDVITSIQNQTAQQVTVSVSPQNGSLNAPNVLKLQTTSTTVSLSVQPAQNNGVNSLAGLKLGILGTSTTGIVTGTPLFGASLSDRLFIVEDQPNGQPTHLTLTARVDASLTLGAALGPIEIELRNSGPAFFEVTASANLDDADGDHRIYLSQLLNDLGSAIDGIPTFTFDGAGTLEVAASLTSGASLLQNIDDPLAPPPLFVVAVAFDNNHLSFQVSQHFEQLLSQFQTLKIDDVLGAVQLFVDVVKTNADLDTLNAKIPLLDVSLNDAIGFVDGLLAGINKIISTVDLVKLNQATNALNTAISNLSLPLESREPLFRALDLLHRVSGSDSTKIPGRLISVALVFKQLIDDVPSGTDGEPELRTALADLIKLVPSLNTLEDRLEDVLETEIRESLDNDLLNLTVQIGFVDYNGDPTDTDRALVVGLKLIADDLINKTLAPKLPITADFGALNFNIDQALHLHAGGTINLGLGVLLSDPFGPPTSVIPFVLVANPTTLIPEDVMTLTGFRSDLNLYVGFDGRFDAQVQFGSLDLVAVHADLSLLKAIKDGYTLPTDAAGLAAGLLPLTNIAAGRLNLSDTPRSDGKKFVIVALTSGSTTQVLSSDQFELQVDSSTGKTYVQITDTQIAVAAIIRATVEYQTASVPDPSPNPNDLAELITNRASLNIQFGPAMNPLITSNAIGAVSFSDLVPLAKPIATLNGMIIGSVDVTFLNSTAPDAVTLAVSLKHLAQPQLVVDTVALGSLLENVDFDFCLVAEGVEAFLSTLSVGLQSQVLTKLPLVGKNLDMAGTFIGKLQTEFVTPFREFVCDLGGSFADVELAVEHFIFDKLGPQHLDVVDGVNVTVKGLGILGDLNEDGLIDLLDVQATLDTQHFEITFTLHGEDKMVVDFDTALDGLPIKSEGQGGVEFGWSYDVDFGIGVDRYQGFYLLVNGDADEEFRLNIGAELVVDTNTTPPIPTTLTVDLLGLKLTATDILTPTGETGTHIGGMLWLDLIDTDNLDNLNRLYFSDIASQPFGETFHASASLAVAINLRLAAAINSDLPSVQTDFMANWQALVTTGSGQIEVAVGAPTIKFTDLGVNLGDFLSKQIGAALNKLDKFISPIKPLIKLLKKEIPGVSELSVAAGNGPLTFLDLALLQYPEQAEIARKFVDTLDIIFGLIDSLKTVDGSDDILFVIKDEVLLGNGSTAATMAASPSGTPANTPAPAPPGNTPNTLKGLLQKLESIGINLEILQPKNIFSLLLHQPFNIISYELPPFELPFTYEQNFPINPLPLIIRIGLDASLFADLSIGYDSRGIETGKFFDGFYFGDLENVSEGEDIPEFGVSLGVRLAALLGVGPISAGIEGEIQANILANFRDTDSDGKLYLDEIKRIVEQDGIKCLFDLTGELRAIVRLVYQLGPVDGSKEFINEILFTFMNHCPDFELGSVTSDGTLLLHAGVNAGLRRSGASTDVAESFTVTELAPGVYKVEGMGLESRYSGVTNKIFFDGGLGDDKLLLVDVTIPVLAFGGAGDDSLEGGKADDSLDGGAGNDILIGHGGADSLSSGANNDVIYGDASPDDMGLCVAGNDTIHGDGGNDLIFGDLGGDSIDGGAGNDMIFGQDGDDVLRGGSGEDRISGGLGGDRMFGDAGNDALVGGVLDSNLLSLFNNMNPDSVSTGQDGNDFIYGGNGNDFLIGDAGSDSLFGGFGNDAIIGFRILNHTDTSADYIEGGPNDDFICGANGNDTILGGTGDPGLALTSILADQVSAGAFSTGGFHLVSCDSIPEYTEPPVGSIRGQFFSDNNSDTLQQAMEPGLNVWTVNLLDDQNAVVATQITANMDLNGNGLIDPQTESGWYSFAGVDPGAYHIQAVLMPGFVQTTIDQMLTVNDGQVVLNDKIGERFQPGVISGRKFEDSNGDGSAGLLEHGVNGWEVQLLDQDGNVLATQVTQSVDLNDDGTIDPMTESGLYSFTDLVPGTYTVSEAPRAGWVQSFPILSAANVFLPITDDGYSQTKSGAMVTGLVGAISLVTVTLDVAHSDVQQLTAILVSPTGTQVRLFQNVGGNGDNFTGTVFDDASGQTISSGMAPFVGNFRPEVSLATFQGEDPNGTWTLIIEDNLEEDVAGRLESWSVTVVTTNGIATGIGGAVNPKSSGPLNSYQVAVGLGEVITTLDFGNYRMSELRGLKFEDSNGNGVRDKNELGLAGVEIYVDLNRNGQWDREEPKTMTQADDPATANINETGTYELRRLPPSRSQAGSNQPASYSVREVLQSGWAQSFPGTVGSGSPQQRQLLASSSQMPTVTISPVSVLEGNSGTTLAVFTVNLSAASMDPLTVNYVTHNGTATAGSDYAAASGSLIFAPGTTSKSFSVVVFGDIQVESNETFIVSVGFPNAAGGADIRAEIVGTIRNDDVSREIHGQKFEDLNANGVRDPGEPGLNGWTIQLVTASAAGPVVLQSTTTADIDLNQDGSINTQTESGLYQFNNLAAGTYLVREVLQSGWTQSAPDDGSYTVIVPGDSLLYTVTNTNELAAIDVVTHSVVIIGVTRDSADSPAARRIRGLAYDSAADILYGMTREGDLVTVNRTTGQTTFAVSLLTGNPQTEFWSGLAFDGANNFYTTNGGGGHELVKLTGSGNAFVETIVGSTTFGAGSPQILGLDFYPASAPAMPVTFNGTHPATNVLYGSIREGNNNTDGNIVVVNATSGAVTTLLGTTTTNGNKIQEIAFHPVTGELYSIHDQPSGGTQAVLEVFNFTTATSTEWGELPFGIREDSGIVGGLGWGGLAFVPPPATNAGQSYDFGNYRLIYLPDGDDVINAGGGNDLVHGDNLVTNPLVVSIGSRRDSIFGEGGMDNLFGQEEDDVLSGGSDEGMPADDTLNGGEGTDHVLQEVDAGIQTLTDSQLMGEGTDWLSFIERATLIGGASANTIDATLFTGSVTLIGKGGNDTLKGSAADDVLQGDEGDDSLDGGIGNDTYVFVGAGLGTDTIVESANLDSDTLDFSGFNQAVIVDLQFATSQTVNATNLVLVLGNATALENVIGSSFGDMIRGNSRDNLLVGGSGDDTAFGGLGDDILQGRDDNDELHGDPDDDVIDGGNGNDMLFGGDGNDVLTGGLDDDAIDGGFGSDLLSEAGSGDFTLTDSSLSGVGTDVLSGLEVANLTGNAGLNTFTVSGWTGTGTLNGAGGSNTVISTNDANFALTDSSLSVTGHGNLGLINITQALLTGGMSDNTIDASAFTGTTTLSGNAGRDTLRGGSGNDLLIGGTDNDQLIGNAGDDTYHFDITWGVDTVVELAGQGFDAIDFSLVNTGLNFTRGVASLTVSDLTINLLTHVGNTIESLIGGTNNDMFIFANGTSLAGGAGRIDGRGGLNTLDDRAFTTAVIVNLMLNQATGLSSLQRIQVVLGGSAADQLTGDNADNMLYGFDGNDVLDGGKGKDHLHGGLGSNTLKGGVGDDTYFIEDRLSGTGTDLLQEDPGLATNGLAANGGKDTIDLSGFTQSVMFNLGNLIALQTTSVTIRLQDNLLGDGSGNFENVIGSLTQTNTLTGNAADNQLTGGLVQDALTGGDGNDSLRGGNGSDVLLGGAGDDVYLFETASSLSEIDLISEETGLGIDTLDFRTLAAGDNLMLIFSTASVSIGSHNNRTIQTVLASQAANFENVFGGSGNDVIFGNERNNRLQGNGGNDLLVGDLGNDLLEGGAGVNSLHGGDGGDTLVAGPGIDSLVGGAGTNVILQGANVVVAPPQTPNAPQLELAYNLAGNTFVQGTFHGRASSTYTLSFFAMSNMTTPLHTLLVTTNSSGDKQFMTMFSPAAALGPFLKATATDAQGNTSQLSGALSVQASVDLAVLMMVDNTAPLSGSTIHYTVSVNNTGSNSATGVIVQDQLPAGVTFVSASPNSGTYVASSGVWSVGTLAAGASATLTITATVDVSAAGQNIVNTAVATVSDQVDTTATNNSDDVTIQSPFAIIRGQKFADSNGNGIKDAGEPGLAGWIIEVRDLQGVFVAHTATLVDNTMTGTDETGLYSFELPADAYRVTELPQPGWQQTFPAGPSFAYTVNLTSGQILNDQNFGNRQSATVVLTSGQQSNGQDFGNYVPGSIHGFKFEDWDGDGHYDVSVEPRLANVQFTLTGSTGPAVQVLTNLSGEFAFTGLAPGSYTVTETVPTGYTATTPTSFTRTLRSGDELVAITGQAKLPANDPRHEVVLGQPLMFGNLPAGVDLEVVKTVSANPVFAGSGIKNLTYLVTVTNRGVVNATGVTLSEDLTLPSGVTLVSVTPSRGTLWSLTKTPDGTWNVGNLSRGASATLTIVLTVSGSAASGTNVIRNTATVTASNQSRYHTADDTATVSTSIRRLDLVVQLPDTRNTIVVSRTGSGDAALLRVRQGTTDLITPTRINTVGSLRIEGGNAADDVTFDSTLVGFLVGTLEVNGNGGNDRLNAAALRVTSVQIGPAFAAIREHGVCLIGGDGDDSLTGGDGPDVLDGGAGNDMLTGNAGNDSLSGGSGTDRLIESADANLTLTNTSLVGVGLDVLSGFESAQLTGGKGKNALNASGFTLGPVLLFGSDGDDSLTGTNAADVLDGGLGNDFLIGLGENDSLTGGAGNDVLNGGEGSDVVVETANVNLTLTNLALAGVGTDTLIGIERAFLTGGAAGNKFDARAFTLGAVALDGLGGNDTLLGGTGDDTLTGKLGNDSLVGGAGTDRLVETGDVNFLLTKVQLSGLGTDFLATIEEVSLTGGAGNNTLTVKDFAGLITLRGAAGNDSLFGGGGNDVLEGDLGDDQLSGGIGDDQLDGGAGTDVVVESGSAAYTLSDSLLIGAGADALMSIELARLTLSNTGGSINASNFAGRTTLTGGTANDSIIGGTGADLLIGGDGADTLAGNAGDDTLTGGLANDSLNGGAGSDVLSETADVASLILTNGALAGLGSDVHAAIERALLIGGAAINSFDASAFTLGPVTLVGGAANDSLLGGSGADSLDGGLGNDTLKGGAGNDTLTGGADSDAFDGGLDTDLLSEIANVNLVLNATQFTGLGTDTHTGIETAFLIGGAGGNKFDATLFGGSVTLIGNAGNDTLIGTATADSLDGGDGNDKLQGGAGNDTLSGGRGSDTLEGGADNDVLDGEADADSLIGGTGRDLLIGGAAIDSLAGGADENILIGGTTSYTGNGTALNAIMAEWTSANAYPTRLANLLNGGGANGSTVLNATTVQNDTNAADKINGSLAAPNNTDLDWFFQSAGDVLDAINGEVRTTI